MRIPIPNDAFGVMIRGTVRFPPALSVSSEFTWHAFCLEVESDGTVLYDLRLHPQLGWLESSLKSQKVMPITDPTQPVMEFEMTIENVSSIQGETLLFHFGLHPHGVTETHFTPGGTIFDDAQAVVLCEPHDYEPEPDEPELGPLAEVANQALALASSAARLDADSLTKRVVSVAAPAVAQAALLQHYADEVLPGLRSQLGCVVADAATA